MKLIAHRALLNGPNQSLENRPEQISFVLEKGYEAEVDVWMEKDQWWLGHDKPTYKTSLDFLKQTGLWIHTKNFEAADGLLSLINQGWNFNVFSHDSDDRTLTSHGFWWTYPQQKLGKFSISVMPEWYIHMSDLPELPLKLNCAGICSDWVEIMKKGEPK